MTWSDVVTGTLLFTLPQIPLTLGNAVIAITPENNELFPDRKVSEKKIAISQGIMNLIAPIFGGVPMCHGAGGMAGHVRFGAKTGGALVILGSILGGASDSAMGRSMRSYLGARNAAGRGGEERRYAAFPMSFSGHSALLWCGRVPRPPPAAAGPAPRRGSDKIRRRRLPGRRQTSCR